MTYDYYNSLVKEAINLGCNADRLLAEIGYPSNIKLDADAFVKAVGIIVAAATNDIRRMAELGGLSVRSLALKTNIPYRTMQNWCNSESASGRKPPEYLPILLGFILISELPKEDDNGNI